MEIIELSERPELLETAARWFHEKWGVPLSAYEESMTDALRGGPVPTWLVAMEDGKIVGGLGVIENDFHERKDLRPNVCAVFVEPECRCRGIAGRLLNEICARMKARGIDTLYLLTDHTGFYERYGWEYLCSVLGDGEDEPARMYIHK